MKRLLLISLALLLSLCGCKPDFDEIDDTDQRNISFVFDSRSLLDSVPVPPLPIISNLTSNTLNNRHRVRLNVYCYSGDTLVDRLQLFIPDGEKVTTTMRHLYKETDYSFLFVGDVVQYNNDDNYLETWFQINTNNPKLFHITSFDQSDTLIYNLLATKIISAQADNQSIDITLQPLTYNGFCILTNASQVDKIVVDANIYNSIQLSSLSALSLGTQHFETTIPDRDTLIFPLTATILDNHLGFKVKTITVAGTDSTSLNIFRHDNKTFVAYIDCLTRQITKCNFYE